MSQQRTIVLWKIGGIEFHIHSDQLVLVRCDADDLFDGGAHVVVTSNKLRRGIRQREVQSILDGRRLEYKIRQSPGSSGAFLQLASGMTLGFVNDTEAGQGPVGFRSWSLTLDRS